MYIRGLIPRNFVELAEAVPIAIHIDTKELGLEMSGICSYRVKISAKYLLIYKCFYFQVFKDNFRPACSFWDMNDK